MLRPTIGPGVAHVLFCLLISSAARADITVTSFSESVHTKISVQPSASVLNDEDMLSVPAPPPTSISVNSVTAFGAAAGAGTASVTVHAYTGPTGIGLSSLTFTIDCDTFGMTSGNALLSSPIPFANAELQMSFTLDDFHPYSYAKSGPFFPGGNIFSRSGVGLVAEGTGILAPGDYLFNVSSLGTGGDLHTIDLSIDAAVPEPFSVSILVPAVIAMSMGNARRRRWAGESTREFCAGS